MLRLLFLSTTSLSLALSGCSDDAACGPGSAKQSGLLASSADVVLNFGGLTSGPNNDCPDGTAPDGVTTLTIQGVQLDGPGLLTLCIPRPDKLQDGPLALGDVDGVRIIDLNGTVDGCTYEYVSAVPVVGTASVTGMCDNGQTTAGYALTADASLTLRKECPTSTGNIAVDFTGTVAVKGLK